MAEQEEAAKTAVTENKTADADANKKAAADKKKADADAKKKADADAKKKADAEAKAKADADAKAKADADAKAKADADAKAEAEAKMPKQVRVICEGTLGPKLLKKGDVTDDPEYVGLLESQGDRNLVVEVK